jgi:peptidoglycan/LPS O-acetylase OafA/YrhL
MTNIKYRPEIDGLRAVAVLSVLIYHAFPNTLPGGFVGVDIFFVISGFLITHILHEELQKDCFSLWNFYQRRIRRIFPALLTIFLIGTLLGWIILTPAEYELFGTHMIAGAGFVPNILFWREAGYFDKEAITKPLLHLWSLGVEEQFYLVWPVVLWVSWKMFRTLRITLGIALVLLILSLLWSGYQIHHNPVADFYSPLSRFWELALGGCLALWSNSSRVILRKSSVSYLGIALIVFSLGWLDTSVSFPGYWALLPCVGAACIILPQDSSFVRQVLSHRILVFVGLISYPLYLWHWPLLSFARILEGQAISDTYKVVILIMSLVLATLTNFLIEKPIRKSRKISTALVLLLCMLLALGFGVVLRKKDGFKHRHSTALSADLSTMVVGEFRHDILRPCQLDQEIPQELDCFADKRDPITYAILGDSKAEALFYGLTTVSSDQGHWLLIDGVHPAPIGSGTDNPTNQRIEQVFKSVANSPWIKVVAMVNTITGIYEIDPKTGLIVSGSHVAREQFEIWSSQISALEKAGKKVVLVIDNPIFPDPTSCISGGLTHSEFLNKVFTRKANPACQIPYDQYVAGTKIYRDWMYSLQQQHPGVVVFDTAPYLCDVKNNLCQITEGNSFLYSYSNHISDFAAKKMGIPITQLVDGLALKSP